MARQQATSQNLKSIATAAFVGLGLVVLSGKVDGGTAQLTNLLGCAGRETMELLHYIVSLAWQALQSYTFDHQASSRCLLQMLVSCWSLLHVLAGAA